MKLLKVKASHFKNCCDDFTIDFTAKSKKTAEDREYELQAVAEDLYVYNTAAFVGKNASGKTTAIELLDCCYSILGEFCLENKPYNYDGIILEIFFYHDGYIYRYDTKLSQSETLSNKAAFFDQKLSYKRYYKSKIKDIFSDDDYIPVPNISELPEDTSITFFVLKKKESRAVYFPCDGEGLDTYRLLFRALKRFHIPADLLSTILKLFDGNIRDLQMVDDHNYRLLYSGKERLLSDKELVHLLSSGTTKGILLYTFVAASLRNGFDLLVDEIENHFHKTLVENMLSLYKDKAVNRSQATLIFTTHYCEVLDLFNRQDNIWVSRAEQQVSLSNMHDAYHIRSELSKSRQFYHDAFDTAVNYRDLMQLKKELMGL